LIHADPSKIDSSEIKDVSLDDILDDLEKLQISIGVEKIGILVHHIIYGMKPEASVPTAAPSAKEAYEISENK
jgi:hypothetical protein